jgi:hypothetical protein
MGLVSAPGDSGKASRTGEEIDRMGGVNVLNVGVSSSAELELNSADDGFPKVAELGE